MLMAYTWLFSKAKSNKARVFSGADTLLLNRFKIDCMAQA